MPTEQNVAAVAAVETIRAIEQELKRAMTVLHKLEARGGTYTGLMNEALLNAADLAAAARDRVIALAETL